MSFFLPVLNWNFLNRPINLIFFSLSFNVPFQCELDHIFQVDSISGFSRAFFGTVWNAFMYVVNFSYVSLIAAGLFLIVAIAFVPSKVSWMTRVMIGFLHVSAHLAAALILILMLELGIETFVRLKLVETSGQFFLSVMWHSTIFFLLQIVWKSTVMFSVICWLVYVHLRW